jgi:hypothetical protein
MDVLWHVFDESITYENFGSLIWGTLNFVFVLLVLREFKVGFVLLLNARYAKNKTSFDVLL